jgi:hypothetical protein
MEFLPEPVVMRCYFDATFVPHVPAMELYWAPDAPGSTERIWHLPQSVSLHSAAPTRFGITVERRGADDYKVRVLWNQLVLAWSGLRRVQIMTSSLSLIARALNTDLWQQLNQPIAQLRAA